MGSGVPEETSHISNSRSESDILSTVSIVCRSLEKGNNRAADL